jgi:hypothetical protein
MYIFQHHHLIVVLAIVASREPICMCGDTRYPYNRVNWGIRYAYDKDESDKENTLKETQRQKQNMT